MSNKPTTHGEALRQCDLITEKFLCGDKHGAENMLNEWGARCVVAWARQYLKFEEYAEDRDYRRVIRDIEKKAGYR